MNKKANTDGVQISLQPTTKIVESTEDSLVKPKDTSEPPLIQGETKNMKQIDLCRSIAKEMLNDLIMSKQATVPIDPTKSIQDHIRKGRYFGHRTQRGWIHSENGVKSPVITSETQKNTPKVIGQSEAVSVPYTVGSDKRIKPVYSQKGNSASLDNGGNAEKTQSTGEKTIFPKFMKKYYSDNAEKTQSTGEKTSDNAGGDNTSTKETPAKDKKPGDPNKVMDFLKTYGKNMKYEFGNVRKAFGDEWKGDGGKFNESMKSGFKALWDSPNLRNTSLAVGGGLLAAGIGSMLLRRRRNRRRYDD